MNKFNSVNEILNISKMAPQPMNYSAAFSLPHAMGTAYLSGRQFGQELNSESKEQEKQNVTVEQPEQNVYSKRAQSYKGGRSTSAPVYRPSAKEELLNNLINRGYSYQEAYAAVFPTAYKQLGKQASAGRNYPKANADLEPPLTRASFSEPLESYNGLPPVGSALIDTSFSNNTASFNSNQPSSFAGMEGSNNTYPADWTGFSAFESAEGLSKDDNGFLSLSMGVDASLTPDQRYAKLLNGMPQNSLFASFG